MRGTRTGKGQTEDGLGLSELSRRTKVPGTNCQGSRRLRRVQRGCTRWGSKRMYKKGSKSSIPTPVLSQSL